ncbi:MAG: phosphoribosylformylglycinamidine synthase subunit PurL [Methanobacterium sp.]|uniref:phosphoribosylformylglycinamidine synthase subunit PurL n=1 Tax=Methanobacterium sp. TaxID=2164 RepID=UPI003C793BDE
MSRRDNMTLTDTELEYIKDEIGREPNSLEYGMLDIMFSEHCSYKSSRPILALFPNEGENVIIGPGDDAGIVGITDELALVIGMESHNHPSAIEPYGGAGTGIGGIIRDIISMGAMPVALLDSLRFGYLEDQRSRYLFEYVVKGISDYGNRVGIPTVGGEVEFDDNFKSNPLVNVLCAGIVRKDSIVRGIAPNVGDVFVLMGGRTGRDGIHGVTFASEELTTTSELESRPAVQIGDPFTKKQVMEATFEALEKVDVQGLKDLGGGGLTCCLSELAAKCGNGAKVEITQIPLREDGMTPYEIMLSESQERMVFVVHPEDVKELMDVFEKYEIPSAVVGEVIEGDQFVTTLKGEILANVPSELLADPPIAKRELRKPVIDEEYVVVKDIDPKDALLKLLSSENIASKEWVYRQYDHEVQIGTIVKPGDDAAVIRVDENTAFAITSDCNSIHTKLDPYNGGAGSVAEAIRNVISMGSEPICIADCLNFGNPEKPEVLWQFNECVKGMSEIARRFNTPVISGNVSFYNETEGVTVNPSPVIGVAGKMDIKDIRTAEFKNNGDIVVIIVETRSEVDGSEYHRSIYGLVQGKAPEVFMDEEYNAGKSVLELIREDDNGNITAVHDCSSGGLGIALSEMSISGNLGAIIDLKKVPVKGNLNLSTILFSESHGRYLITVKKDSVEEVLSKITVPCAIIGEVQGDSLVIEDQFTVDVEELKKSYKGIIEKFMA